MNSTSRSVEGFPPGRSLHKDKYYYMYSIVDPLCHSWEARKTTKGEGGAGRGIKSASIFVLED